MHWEGLRKEALAKRHAFAVAMTVLAALARLSLNPIAGTGQPFILFFVSLMITCWFCGRGPAVTAAALGGAAATWLFLPPFDPAHAPANIAGLLLYAAVSAVVILIIEAQRRVRDRAETSARVAEERSREAQRAEEAQEHQRLLSKQTLASIGDGVIVVDARARVQFINPVAESLTGWKADEAVGQPLESVFRIVNEGTLAPVDNPIPKVLREGIIAGLANHTMLLARDGRAVPIDDSGAPIRDRQGSVIGAVLVFRDISERRRAERRLQESLVQVSESEARLRAFLETASQGILVVDGSGTIVLVNAKIEEMFGYTREELLGQNLELLLPERYQEIHSHHRADYFAHPRARPMGIGLDLSGRKKDGAEFPLEISLSHVRESGAIRAIAFVTDITDRVRVEEQLRQSAKLESLGVLAGGVAHDFNNLLTGIIGNASLALDMLPGDSPVSDSLQQVIRAGEQAASLTRQLLAYSGKGRFVVRLANLSAVVQDITELLHSSVPKNVELRLELEEGLPPVECDTTQIQQLIMNLVINAGEAIGEAPGTVTIETGEGTQASARLVWLRVSDTGCGMDEAIKSKIFDPFFTTKFTGRGLGLAAAMGIVRGHNGGIELESAPGRGSVFTVVFPAAEGVVGTRESEPAKNLRGQGTILVVDDEEIVRRTAKLALERYGYKVLLANNGRAAVELLAAANQDISAVLLDLTMPIMSGEEALPHLRSVRHDVPVILSSGYTELEAVRRFHGQGLAGFLQKPYTIQGLAEKIKTVVSNWQAAV